MLSVCLSLLLVGVGVSFGVGLPLLQERRAQARERASALADELLRQREIIADYEATIEAYRRYAQHDPELSGASR